MIAIIGAMEQEIAEIIKLMDDVSEVSIDNIQYYQGKLANKEVVVLLSNVGKVMSALTTTSLINNFDVDLIINIGSAGGLSNKLKTLDTIVATNVAQADFDLTAFNQPLNFENKRITFQSDLQLVKILKDLKLADVYFGNIVSSDTFVNTVKLKNKILSNFPTALACDMEAGAIAMVSNHFNIKFIIIRSISDVISDNKDNSLEFYDYLKLASKNSSKITLKLIENLSE